MSASHFLIIFKAEPVLLDMHLLKHLSEKSLVIKPGVNTVLYYPANGLQTMVVLLIRLNYDCQGSGNGIANINVTCQM